MRMEAQMTQVKFDFSATIADPDRPCYFITTGEPGIGKMAIAARLTQIRNLAVVR